MTDRTQSDAPLEEWTVMTILRGALKCLAGQSERKQELLSKILDLSDEFSVGTRQELTREGFPAVFTVGNRTYRIHSLLREKPEQGARYSWSTESLEGIGAEIGAAMSEEDGEYILSHQDELPKEYRGEIQLVFPKWLWLYKSHWNRLSERYDHQEYIVGYLRWIESKWERGWGDYYSRSWHLDHYLVSREDLAT